MVAGARAALRCFLTGRLVPVVAVRMPEGFYYPVPILASHCDRRECSAVVEKDGGDDPDVTHKARIHATVRAGCVVDNPGEGSCDPVPAGICLTAGSGVGTVTKPGLPVAIGEPAINPVPRRMLLANLAEELQWQRDLLPEYRKQDLDLARQASAVFLNWPGPVPEAAGKVLVEVTVAVPTGASLARKTLNPRLGIIGGISILGTTGLVKPFSHRAYEETIEAALHVAAANGCVKVVLSTGGKSEKAAQRLLHQWPLEAFVQIADFFAFAVEQSVEMGFKQIVHSIFFGKAVKMAEGHLYTHAHRVPLSLKPVLAAARKFGLDSAFCDRLAAANTARHASELLLGRGAKQVIDEVALQAARQSFRIADRKVPVRVLLYDYDSRLLSDVSVS